jgi:hypothetical protein
VTDTNLNLADYTPNEGIITDGLCATPEAQAEFDKNQKGKPPLVETDGEGEDAHH